MEAKSQLRVIGITGRKGSGKDHVAKLIGQIWRSRTDHLYRRLSFATPMKDIVAMVFRVPRHILDLDDHIKTNYKTTWKWADLQTALQEHFPEHGEFVTAREAVQMIGYDVFRCHFSDSVWLRYMVDELDSQVASCKMVIIADVRFPEEAEMLKGRGALILRVVDPHATVPEGGHKTETKMDSIKVDHTIQNDRKREPFDLEQEVDRVVFPDKIMPTNAL